MHLIGAFTSLLAASLVQASSSDVQATIVSATGETQQQEASSAYQKLKEKNATSASVPSGIDHGKAMIDWMRAHGGFVHESLFIGPIIMDDSNSKDDNHNYNNTPYGLFTREPLKAGETILNIPYELTIHTHAMEKFDQCETARKLHREMQLGAESFFAPYIMYLLDTQAKGQVPTLWSKDGQNLLRDMLRHDATDEDGNSLSLPPYDVTTWEYLEDCNPTLEEEFALELLRYRSWDEVLIPVYDMMSHSNDPNVLNTVSSKIMLNAKKDPIEVKAKIDVPAGGQLYCSYNVYTGSKDLADSYGTAELLIDFGFVETLPQRWFFDEYQYMYDGEDEEGRTEDDVSIAFELSRADDGNVTVTWLDDWMGENDVDFAREALEHLKSFDKEQLQARPDSIPEREWNTIKEYNHAMSFALESALQAHFYDPLKFGDNDKYTINEEIYSEDRHYTCDHYKTHAFPGHKTMEWVVSHYQRLEFDVHPKTRETCFWLDMYVQQCTSYRPHYHEVAIHYTAKYLDKVQRIAWIGGGDSMLLHDALKYPTLELALGLELDQKVTRYNYKYMGSQPHYDNEKVEWWYGDATKSLLMLPQEYFGSFDMIVIDLSDTAMQLSVTSDLSIFAALSLLLRPGGIMVKNEEYLEQFSRVFDYTVQAHFYDVPIVCSQSFILGSYGNDFLTKEPKDHKPTDLMFVNQRPDIESRFGIWHDYRRNISRTNAHCQEQGATDAATADPVEQTTSPGILMVVEAENVTINLASTANVKYILVKALEQDAKVDVTEAIVMEETGIIGLVLSTGYVIARTFPKFNYCSIDIHFWSKFELQEVTKKALISSLGGGTLPKSVSSYRIVAGGMFGVDTWKDDAKKQGPRKVHKCENRPDLSRGAFTDQKLIDQITSELLTSLVGGGTTSTDVLVVCGAADCKTSVALKQFPSVNSVHDIRSCARTGSYSSMEACELEVFTSMDSFAVASKGFSGFHAMVIDPEAPLEILQIVLNLFKARKIWQSFTMKNHFLIIANSLDPNLSVRRAFLDRFRKETTDPAHRAEVLFNTTDSSLEAGLFLYGEPEAFERITQVVAKIEKDTGLASEVRNIGGGMFKYQHDFDPAHVYKHSDFDMKDALAQWETQQPTGFQTIFQFVKLTPEEQLDVHDKVMILYPEDGQWYPGKVVWVHPADDTVDVRYDSGDIGKGISTNLVKKDASNSVATDASTDKEAESLSAERIKDALKYVLDETKFEGMEKANVYHYSGPGEGSMTMAFWSGGNAVALWDGRSHIDINLFTYTEDVEVADSVQELFKKRIPSLKTALRDEQPRGYGRVVNYLRDVEEYKDYLPVWAEHLEEMESSKQKSSVSYL